MGRGIVRHDTRTGVGPLYWPPMNEPAPPPSRGRSSAVGRAAWGIADQALSSLTNFGLAVGVASQIGTADFGAFSIAFAVFLVALTISRAVATDPLMIRYSARSTAEWRTGTTRATGMAFVAGVAGGAVSIVAGLVLGGSLGISLLVVGIGLPALLVQDAWRYAFFAARRGRAAFLNDLLWAVVLMAGFVVIAVTDQGSVGAFALAWVGGAFAGALAGMAQAGVIPRPRLAQAWWSEHHDISPRLAVEAAILSGAHPIALSLMGIVAGLATVGTIRAGQALMNAIHIATYGIHLFGVPEAVRMLERSTAALIRFCLVLAVGLMALALTWGIVLHAVPDGIGRGLLGASWESARTVLLPVTFLAMAGGAQGGAVVGLRSLAAATRSLRARVVSSLLLAVGAVTGAAVGGAVTAAWGMALGVSVGSLYWWLQLLRAAEDRRRMPSVQPEISAAGIPSI